MAFENVGSGALFKNNDKRTESSPDYTGKITIEGNDYNLSGWINVGKDGSKIAGQNYLAIKASVKTGEGGNPGDGRTPLEKYQAGDMPF